MAAIYMWPPKPGVFITLTTTLYPVDMYDSMAFGISFNGGSMPLIPWSEMSETMSFHDGTYIQKRWFYTDGPYDSDMSETMEFMDGTYIQKRWFYTDGPYDSDMSETMSFQDGTFINKKVEADTPEELLQLNCVLNASNCSMDLA